MPKSAVASLPRIALGCLSIMIGCGGDGGGGPTETPQFGTVSGVVREAGGPPLGSVMVFAGSLSTTTAANGAFSIRNVPVGPVNIVVNAAGYNEYAQSVTVQVGSNEHDVLLTRRALFASGEVVGYLPTTISSYRGVIYLLAGSGGDSRAFVRGEPICWAYQGTGAVCPNNADFRVRLLALAERHGLALLGVRTMPANDLEAHASLIAGVAAIAEQSGHPELANAPILLVGSSLGGCIAHGFTRLHAARVIGFMSAKGNCHAGGPSDARVVPGYLFFSEEDPVSPGAAAAITQLFLANRAEGAVWSLANDAGSGHEFPEENNEIIAWMEAVLMRRLPANHVNGAPLAAVTEASGWLANRTSFAVAGHSCYSGNKLEASWLPNEQTARHWQAIVGGTGTVTACP